MRKALFTLALLGSAFTLPLTAHADTIDQFTFNFDTLPGYIPVHVTMDVPASPPLSPYNFICGDCFVVFGESSPTYIFKFFQFAPGGSTLVNFALYSGFGPLPVDRAYTQIFASDDLFTGSLSNPTFIPGTFDAVYRPFPGSPDFPGTITIEPIDTTTPEPSSLILLTTGALGLTGFAARRRVAHV
jgi:PEP-CTERM motif